jgi:prefoldin subunit 5
MEYARLDAMAQKAGGVGINQKNQQAADEINESGGAPSTRMRSPRTGPAVGEETGRDLARDHAAIGAGDTVENLGSRAEALAKNNPELRAELDAVQKEKDALGPQVTAVVTAATDATTAVTALSSANNRIAAAGARMASDSARKKFEAAQKAVAANRKVISSVAGMLMSGGTSAVKDLSGLADNAVKAGKGKAVGAANEQAVGLIEKVIASIPGMPSIELSAKDRENLQESQLKAEEAAIHEYNSNKQALEAAAGDAKSKATQFTTRLSELDQKKRNHRKDLAMLGAKLDAAEAAKTGKKKKMGEVGSFETIGTFIAEADVFIADCEAAIQVGEKEMAEKGAIDNARVERTHIDEVRYYHAVPQLVDGKRTYAPYRQTARLSEKADFRDPTKEDPNRGKGSMEDDPEGKVDGGRTTIQKAIESLRVYQTEIKGYQAELGKALGM